MDLKAAGEEEDSIDEGKYDDGADVQGEGEVVELEDAEEECAARRVAADPGAPTAEEVEEHEVDHLPYRCWCEACVRGRGTGDQHRAGPESRVPVISFDYLLVTKAGVKLRGEAQPGEVLLKILVVKDSMSKAISAHAVSCKGIGADGYAVEKLKRDILWLGYSRVTLRSDNEPAIVALLQEVLRGLKVQVVDQVGESHPAAYDSKGNGSVENAVRLVQGLLRTVKYCLEVRFKRRIPAEHPVMAWLVKHVAWLLTVRSRGTDGKTAYERIRGRGFGRKMVGFGETCLFKLPVKGPEAHDEDGKLKARWCRGVFLGYDRVTNEYVFHSSGRIG